MSVRVLGICGSMRSPSATHIAVEAALRGAESAGAQIEFVDIATTNLPFCDGRDDPDTYPEEVQRFRAMVNMSDGIIIGTPEYHNSLTGSLKNAIDLCTANDFEHKMVGLLGLGGGAMGAINAINQLRIIMRGVGAWVIPHQVSIANSDAFMGNNGQLWDNGIDRRLAKLGSDVTRFAKLMAAGIIDLRGMEEV
jgi:NAD(P)H-dependent FMN reductase